MNEGVLETRGHIGNFEPSLFLVSSSELSLDASSTLHLLDLQSTELIHLSRSFFFVCFCSDTFLEWSLTVSAAGPLTGKLTFYPTPLVALVPQQTLVPLSAPSPFFGQVSTLASCILSWNFSIVCNLSPVRLGERDLRVPSLVQRLHCGRSRVAGVQHLPGRSALPCFSWNLR